MWDHRGSHIGALRFPSCSQSRLPLSTNQDQEHSRTLQFQLKTGSDVGNGTQRSGFDLQRPQVGEKVSGYHSDSHTQPFLSAFGLDRFQSLTGGEIDGGFVFIITALQRFQNTQSKNLEICRVVCFKLHILGSQTQFNPFH